MYVYIYTYIYAQAAGCFKCENTRCDFCKNFLVDTKLSSVPKLEKHIWLDKNFRVILLMLFIWFTQEMQSPVCWIHHC